MSISVGMPQMACNGLSENWLFRHCGDVYWSRLCATLGTRSSALCDEAGARLYPTFFAIRARYSAPLCAIEENDVVDTEADLAHFGRSLFKGTIRLRGPRSHYQLEMVTTFVSREQEGRNLLKKSTPAASFEYGCPSLEAVPELVMDMQSVRSSTSGQHLVEDASFDLAAPALLSSEDYEPSPYIDFNGANLLYFASYPTLADTLERQMVNASELKPAGGDWGLQTSTVARDIFYYANLDVGQRLRAQLLSLQCEGERAATHVRLLRIEDQAPIADVFTVRQFIATSSQR